MSQARRLCFLYGMCHRLSTQPMNFYFKICSQRSMAFWDKLSNKGLHRYPEHLTHRACRQFPAQRPNTGVASHFGGIQIRCLVRAILNKPIAVRFCTKTAQFLQCLFPLPKFFSRQCSFLSTSDNRGGSPQTFFASKCGFMNGWLIPFGSAGFCGPLNSEALIFGTFSCRNENTRCRSQQGPILFKLKNVHYWGKYTVFV